MNVQTTNFCFSNRYSNPLSIPDSDKPNFVYCFFRVIVNSLFSLLHFYDHSHIPIIQYLNYVVSKIIIIKLKIITLLFCRYKILFNIPHFRYVGENLHNISFMVKLNSCLGKVTPQNWPNYIRLKFVNNRLI